MNEQQRVQYLEAMGIDSYVPKWLLVNAPEPCLCELAAPASDRLQESSQAPASSSIVGVETTQDPDIRAGAGLQNISEVTEKLSSVFQEGATESAVKPFSEKSPAESPEQNSSEGLSPKSASQTVGQPVQNSDAVSFQLGLWSTESGLHIIDTREAGDALPTHTLLANILIANGLLATQLAAMETIQWPLSANAQGDTSWRSAGAMIHDFFQARFESRPPLAMILCGEMAVKAVLGERSEYRDCLYTRQRLDNYGIDAMVLPSLRDFLYEPASKQHIWSALSPLRALASG